MKKTALIIIFFMVQIGYSQVWDSLSNQAFNYYQKGKYKSALELYDQALTQAKTEFGDESKEYAQTLHAIGKVYSEGGKYEKSVTYYQQALGIKEKIYGKENTSYATTLNNLGTVYIYMGNYFEAEKAILESAGTRKKLLGATSADYSTSLNNLAYLYQMMNRFEDSEASYLESLEITEKVEGVKNEHYARGLNNLGYLYQEMGRYDESERFYLDALNLKAELFGPNHPHCAETKSNLAVLYTELGLYKKAINYLLEAKDVFFKILGNTDPTYATIINNLASAYKAVGFYDEAETYFKEALEINRSTVGESSPYYAMGLGNLGILYSDTKRYDLAVDMYQKSVKILGASVGKSNPRYGESLANLASAYHKSGMLKEADTNYRLALAIREKLFDPMHPSIASIKNNMAMLYWDMNDLESAKKYFRDALHIITYQIANQSQFLSESEMSLFMVDNGFYGKTFYSFCNNFYTQDPGIILDMNNYYNIVNGILLKNANQLKYDISVSGDTVVLDKYTQWQALKTNINKQMALPEKYRNGYLNQWELEASNLEKELLRTSASFKTNLDSKVGANHKPYTLLKPNEVLVEFISFPNIRGMRDTDSILYAAMVTKPNDSLPKFIPLFEENCLDGLLLGDTLRTFANLLYTDAQVRNVENEISYGDSLYKLIWKPLESYLKNVTKIYFIPSGTLHKLSHDAIPVNDSENLSDVYQLERISSSSQLINNANQPFNLERIALFGGIRYELDTVSLKANYKNNNKKIDDIIATSRGSNDDTLSRGGAWSYLPGAKAEVDQIGNLLKKASLKYSVFTDFKGSEESVKNLDGLKSPSVLHFSTHGFFFPPGTTKTDINVTENPFASAKNPLFRSGLIFAGANYVWKGNPPIDNTEDGILTAFEVSNLFLPNTRLVVMSACETGLGDIKRSEGVYGLQRGFKMAGVDYIIMTLWQVLDKETSDFMTLFYQNLLNKKNIPDAFKATQDEMKNKYRDEPYKWAGFVLIN
jgi:tetratricopeptide (TPR) repeat protein/CHAT domain-containing protein